MKHSNAAKLMMTMTTNTMMRATMMMMVIAKTLQQAATFDTMWHSTMPQVASLYALKLAWEKEHGIRRCKMPHYHFYQTSGGEKISHSVKFCRRYGFHGLSHKYVVDEVRRRMGGRSNLKVSACLYKGRCHLRFSGIRPLRGYPPPS